MATKTPDEYSSLSEKQVDRIERHISMIGALILSIIYALGGAWAANTGALFPGLLLMGIAAAHLSAFYAEKGEGVNRTVMDPLYRRLNPEGYDYYSELSEGESDR